MRLFVTTILLALLVSPCLSKCLRGDVNLNGCVNIADVVMFFEFLHGRRLTLPPCGGVDTDTVKSCKLLDVNRDGDVCPADPIDLLAYLYGRRQLDLRCD